MDNELKYCPHCDEFLPRSQFGICRARSDGLNLYCKRSIRIKIAAQRLRLKEYKAAQNNRKPKEVAGFSRRRIARMLRKFSPTDRVREAIRCGAKLQSEIAQVTKLPKDEVCDALAQLLLWSRDIRTVVINGERMYFIAEGDIRRRPVRTREPRSYGVSAIYFAA